MKTKLRINVKELLLRVIILLIGLTIAHLGVTLFLLANLGSDPFNVLIQGIFNKLLDITNWSVLTHGRVHIMMCLLIVIILLFVDKSYIKIGTLLCMICGGPIIDFFTWILGPLFAGDVGMIVRIITNCLGCVILAYGMTIVITSDAGTGPNDLVAIVISDKAKKSFGIMRVVVDVSFALIGFLLGGTLGIGTVICAFLVGPVANYFLPHNKKLVDKIINRYVAH